LPEDVGLLDKEFYGGLYTMTYLLSYCFVILTWF